MNSKKIYRISFQIWYPLCKNPACYLSYRKTQVTAMILKWNPIHASVISQFLWIHLKFCSIKKNSIGITVFTTWKQKMSSNKMLLSEYWSWDLSHLDLMLSSLSYWGMYNLGDLRSLNGYALLVLPIWSMSKNEVVQEQNTFKDIKSIRALDLNGWVPIKTRKNPATECYPNKYWTCSKASDASIAITAN